jgi:hypothetical protein
MNQPSDAYYSLIVALMVIMRLKYSYTILIREQVLCGVATYNVPVSECATREGQRAN